jgi:hypothetical protein
LAKKFQDSVLVVFEGTIFVLPAHYAMSERFQLASNQKKAMFALDTGALFFYSHMPKTKFLRKAQLRSSISV